MFKKLCPKNGVPIIQPSPRKCLACKEVTAGDGKKGGVAAARASTTLNGQARAMVGDRSRAGSRVAVNQGRSAARSRGRRQGESDGSVQQDRPDAATSATGTARVTASADGLRRQPVRWCTSADRGGDAAKGRIGMTTTAGSGSAGASPSQVREGRTLRTHHSHALEHYLG
jgi:hypothetical protein